MSTMLLMNHATRDVRAVEDDLEPCCLLMVWDMLIDMGYAPFGPAANAFSAQVSAARARKSGGKK
jgi:hypothetical protein